MWLNSNVNLALLTGNSAKLDPVYTEFAELEKRPFVLGLLLATELTLTV